jgi:hypothetical protein
MWREMSLCHQAQLRAVEAIRRLDNSAACEPSTSSHRHSTQQLEVGLNKYVLNISLLLFLTFKPAPCLVLSIQINLFLLLYPGFETHEELKG